MRYREYGRTGRLVSEVGMGGHREGVETRGGLERNARFFRPVEERAAVVGRAIDRGVTYFDTTFGCEIASLGESLRALGRREGLFCSGMRVDFFANLLRDPDDPRAYTRREVEGRLREFGFEQMEQFIMGAMEQGDPVAHPAEMEAAFEELEALVAEGKIGHIGFSCHDPDYAARLLEAYPRFDAAMVPYNHSNPAAEGRFAAAIGKTGAAWIAMKTLVWRVYGIGAPVIRTLRPVAGRLEHDPDAPIATLALRRVLDQPLLTTCVPAANSAEAVDENVAASERGRLTSDEIDQLDAYRRAGEAEEMAFLALGGLHAHDGRTLSMAIGLAGRVFGLPAPPIDWDAADGEERARSVAAAMLAELRRDARWAQVLPEA